MNNVRFLQTDADVNWLAASKSIDLRCNALVHSTLHLPNIKRIFCARYLS